MKNKQIIEPLKILITGKSGVGKSTFVNFLFGREVFKTGVGKPVTKGIQTTAFEISNTTIEIIDTEGLEPNNIDEIKNKINNLIKKDDTKLSPIHGIFYLINAASARLEDFEIDYIREMSQYGMPIFVVLTHIDIAKDAQIDNLKEIIIREIDYSKKHISNVENILIIKKSMSINIIELALVSKSFRGKKAPSISKEDLQSNRQKLIESFFKLSAKYYLYYNIFKALKSIRDDMDDFKKGFIEKIENIDISIFNIMEWDKKIEDLTEYFDEIFDKKFNKFEYIQEEFISVFNSISNEIKFDREDVIDFDCLDKISEEEFLEKIEIIKNLNENIKTLENNDASFIDKTISFLNLGSKAITPESTLKDIINEFFNELDSIFNKIRDNIKERFENENWKI